MQQTQRGQRWGQHWKQPAPGAGTAVQPGTAAHRSCRGQILRVSLLLSKTIQGKELLLGLPWLSAASACYSADNLRRK